VTQSPVATESAGRCTELPLPTRPGNLKERTRASPVSPQNTECRWQVLADLPWLRWRAESERHVRNNCGKNLELHLHLGDVGHVFLLATGQTVWCLSTHFHYRRRCVPARPHGVITWEPTSSTLPHQDLCNTALGYGFHFQHRNPGTVPIEGFAHDSGRALVRAECGHPKGSPNTKS
jgi:hypothetical protein